MVDYTSPTIPIFQNDNIKRVENCYIIRKYTFNNNHYALIQIELIDKRSPDNLTWFTVDVNINGDTIWLVSHHINIANDKKTPKLYKLEWGDKQAIKSIIDKNLEGFYGIISERVKE